MTFCGGCRKSSEIMSGAARSARAGPAAPAASRRREAAATARRGADWQDRLMTDSFPRQQARTRNFSLGVPRSFQVSPDGARIVFLRSKSGSDPVTCLWAADLPADPSGQDGLVERLIVDPVAVGANDEEPGAERARRERSREIAGGVVAFAADADCTMAA